MPSAKGSAWTPLGPKLSKKEMEKLRQKTNRTLLSLQAEAANNSEDDDELSSAVASKEDDNLNNNPAEHLTASNTSKPTNNIGREG